ncbi:UNVERIFIED_CONTAM: Rhodanese-like domain-containing protein 6 [Sesamum latifolium]|uniref:Rhodanese-like domain-containing protein 6 n=1 Tax=Sesamum latifolium TaxID=2727402 RepID=A0AAW2XM44_9LAMI
MADPDISPQMENGEQKDYGVLLYYKYTAIPDLQELFDFYHSNCTSLSLLGRVRLSSHGVNVTVGGRLRALEEHIEAVKSNALFEGTDFKLASCFEPLDNQVARECGFTSLSIRIVKVLGSHAYGVCICICVNVCVYVKEPKGGRQLRKLLMEVERTLTKDFQLEAKQSKNKRKRRIFQYLAEENCNVGIPCKTELELVTLSSHPLLKSPEISDAGRHLSAAEFHSVLQSAGKCEEKSAGSDKKLILLDARNLYETRIGKFDAPDVKTLDPEIRQYSDLPSWIDNNTEQLRGNNILMYCTGGIRCEMASAYIRSKGAGFENVFQLYGGIQRYMEQFSDGGFFKGKNFVFDHRVSVGSSDSNVLGTCLLCGAPFDDYTSRCRCTHCRMLVLICDSCRKKYCNQYLVVIVSTLIKEVKNASSFKGRTASLAKKLKNIAELVFVDAPHELPFIYHPPPTDQSHSCSSALSQQCPPFNHCNRKFAWLVAADYDGTHDAEWKIAKVPFDSLQYQQQTEGFEKSIEYLKTVFSEAGPFDGILGFSQGAAMAALVGAHREKLKCEMDFRFVVLCSGFAVNMTEYAEGSINCPSLHIFGCKEGKDRQIECEASRKLASLFQNGSSVIIEHDLGHIIPTRSPYIDEIKDFLRRFL